VFIWLAISIRAGEYFNFSG
jgi:hypothetical protein